MTVRVLLFSAVLFLSPAGLAQAAPPGQGTREVLFEVRDGKALAARALHVPADLQKKVKAVGPGWAASGEGEYISYGAPEVFPKEEGTLDIRLVVLGNGADDEPALGKGLESLVTLYDSNDVPFFTVAMNDHDLTVGSFPLHPMAMEDVFGATGFTYLGKLDGPLRKGTEMTITVTWGRDPSVNNVYVNNRLIRLQERRGPKTGGKGPGYPPRATLGSFMNGFKGAFNGRDMVDITPPKTLTIGKMDIEGKGSGLVLHAPTSVAIKGVAISSLTEDPMLRMAPRQ